MKFATVVEIFHDSSPKIETYSLKLIVESGYFIQGIETNLQMRFFSCKNDEHADLTRHHRQTDGQTDIRTARQMQQTIVPGTPIAVGPRCNN